MLTKAKNRWQAFAIHLVVSLLLFLVLSSVIYFLWYPGILFIHDGGLEGMKLIASVDFLIGPFLTLMVYKLGKKSLPFDLAVIALLQVVCLVGGMWTVWQTRPVAVVYADGTFRSIPYQTYRDYGVDPDTLPLLEGRWPVWVAVNMPPEKLNEWRQKVPFKSMVDPHLFFQVEYYVPLSQAMPEVLTAGKYRSDLTNLSEKAHFTLPAIADDRLYYRAGLGSGAGLIAFDKLDGKAVDFVLDMPREKSLSTRYAMLKVEVMELVNRLVK